MSGAGLAQLPAVDFRDAEETGQRGGHGQGDQRPGHHRGRFVRALRLGRLCGAEERDQHQARHVEGRQQRHTDRQDEQPQAPMFGIKRGGDDLVFAEKPTEGRHAAQGHRARHERPIRGPHPVVKRAHSPDVLLVMKRVDDRARAEKE